MAKFTYHGPVTTLQLEKTKAENAVKREKALKEEDAAFEKKVLEAQEKKLPVPQKPIKPVNPKHFEKCVSLFPGKSYDLPESNSIVITLIARKMLVKDTPEEGSSDQGKGGETKLPPPGKTDAGSKS